MARKGDTNAPCPKKPKEDLRCCGGGALLLLLAANREGDRDACVARVLSWDPPMANVGATGRHRNATPNAGLPVRERVTF